MGLLVLLVEDEPLIIDMMGDALVEGGYEVVKAASAKAALDEIEVDASRFRAVVTDIRLGSGPDGWEVAQKVRQAVPQMPVVYMSGDSVSDWASRGVPGSVILAKPFAPAQLITAVSTLATEADTHTPPAQRN